MKFTAPITPGAHANIHQGILISPGGSSGIDLVCKQGQSSVLSEIEIYKLIASNPKSAQRAILRPFFNETNLHANRLYFPLMPGSNLDKQQTYVFKTLNTYSNKYSIAYIWLYKQLLSLLETLKHLHEGTFSFHESVPYIGIVHGDIKPANILINASGCLILADFGCAYPMAKPAKQFGSLCYTAPELFANKNFASKAIKNSDKSDIWSLGITLYYLLANTFPNLFKEIPCIKNNKLKNHFFKKRINSILFKTNDYIASNPTFFREGIEGDLYRKSWGENYSRMEIAIIARKALHRLESSNYTQYYLSSIRSYHLSVLYDLALAMLAPVDERPSAARLVDKMKGTLLSHFESYNNLDEYNKFISDLLAHSPLYQNIGYAPTPLSPCLLRR